MQQTYRISHITYRYQTKLSMISMADHCTRRIYHGTPIHEDTSIPQPPIVGLLFGTVSEQKSSPHQPPPPQQQQQDATTASSGWMAVNISDAEDVPILFKDSVSAALTAIELHQAVYTDHIVVGWYRVNVLPPSTTNDYDDMDVLEEQRQPTAEDLLLSQQLLQQYSTTSSRHSTTGTTPFVFALLHVHASSPSSGHNTPHDTKMASTTTSTTLTPNTTLADMLTQNKEKAKSRNGRKNYDDDNIPLSLYLVDKQEQVLIGLDYYSTVNDTNRSNPSSNYIDSASNNSSNIYSWKLMTAPYERIAVERIMEYNSKSNSNNSNVSPLQLSTSKIQQSLYAIYERLDTLECSLQLLLSDTSGAKITDPSTLSLLRHVNSLLLHVNTMSSILVPTTATSESTITTTTSDIANTARATTTLLQQLVTLSETICTIQKYTDKLHIVEQYNRDVTTPNAVAIAKGHGDNVVEGTSRQHTRAHFPLFE